MPLDQAVSTQIPPSNQVTVTAPAPIKAFSDGDAGPSFKDVLDIINPLQHIPIINTIYRHLTGDEEGAVADVAGGALYAGPVGLVGSMIDLAVKGGTGRSIGDNVLHWLGLDDDDEKTQPSQTQAQQAQQAQQTATAVAPPPAVTIQALAALPARQRGEDKSDRKDARQGDKADAVDGPSKAGDYLVFGGGANQPIPLTPSQPTAPAMAAASPAGQDVSGPARQGQFMVFGGASQPAPSIPAQAEAAPVQTAAADVGSAGHQGEYWVFGATAVPAAPAKPVQLAQASAAFPTPAPIAAPAPMPPVATSVTGNSPLPPIGSPHTDAVANSVPPGGGPAQLSPLPSRSFAAPARRAQVTPNALPMPTTGPAAVPHNVVPSQALHGQAQADQSWFVNAVNVGLDRYAAAQRLAGPEDLAASATAGAQSTALH